jgi:FdhD protein
METDLIRIQGERRERKRDVVADEVPVTMYLNGEEFVTMLASPADLKELSVGFLYSAGLIQSADEVENVTIDETRWASHIELKDREAAKDLVFKRLYTSGCGRGVQFYSALDLAHRREIESNFRISADALIELMRVFEKRSELFRKTGGVHSAGMSDGSELLIFREDIGRHNALDKVIGEALMRVVPMKDSLVMTSGRISSEIIFKVQKMGAAALASRSAPTDQAVKIARACNLTLLGFVRGKRMNVYAGEERIT